MRPDERQLSAVKASTDSLQAELDALRASRKRLVLAADAARRTIERELHDGIQQELVALVVKAQLARRLVETDPAGVAMLLAEIQQEAQTALDETRKLAQRVYPSLRDAVGLRAALLSAAAAVEPAPAIDVVLAPSCPEELAAATYFCCMELLERVPGIEAIDIRQQERSILVALVARKAPADHSAAKDRVEALGGRVEIVTEPDARVRITCALPLA
jgi:signal transduction histidine kinase